MGRCRPGWPRCARVGQVERRLNPWQREPALHALEHLNDVALNPVARLAALSGVAASAFIRMAEALGLAGRRVAALVHADLALQVDDADLLGSCSLMAAMAMATAMAMAMAMGLPFDSGVRVVRRLVGVPGQWTTSTAEQMTALDWLQSFGFQP